MKLSAVAAALAIAGGLAVSGQALADQVNAKLESVTPLSKNYRVKIDITSLPGNPGEAFSSTEYAGIFDFTLNSGNLNTYDADSFVSFCIDVTDSITVGSAHTWNVVSLADAPDQSSGPMGSTRADALATLLGSNLGTSLNDAVTVLDDNTKRAAMQVAIWEVVFESAGGPYKVAEGNAKFTNNDTVTAQAQLYLDNIAEIGTKMSGLVGLTSTNTQDFIGQVPIPAAAWLFGSALIGTIAIGRRKTKAKTRTIA